MDLPEALITIDLLRGQIEMHEPLLSERAAKIRDLEAERQLGRHDIVRLRTRLYGDRSERVAPDKLTLPGVDLAPSNDTATPPEPEKKRRVREHERTTKRRAPLTLDPVCVTDKHVYVTPEQTACCGAAMTSIGEETRVCVERVPACLMRTFTHRLKFACGPCKRGGVHIAQPEDYSVLGPTPEGPSLAAGIAMMHYADHRPFKRIAGILRREGLTIDCGALSRTAGRVAEAPRIVVALMGAGCLRATTCSASTARTSRSSRVLTASDGRSTSCTAEGMWPFAPSSASAPPTCSMDSTASSACSSATQPVRTRARSE